MKDGRRRTSPEATAGSGHCDMKGTYLGNGAGLELAWHEQPYQWIEGRMLTSLRTFVKGPAKEGGIRVPMIVKGPGMPSGGITHAYVTVMDLAPTFLDLAGLQ